MSRYRFVQAHTRQYAVRRLCQVLGVGVASYYRWQKGATHSSVPAWERALCQVFVQHQRRYGTRRLRAELQAQGCRVGRQRIRHALRRRELVAVQPRAFVPRTTQREHGPRVAPNHLLARPAPTAADQVWVLTDSAGDWPPPADHARAGSCAGQTRPSSTNWEKPLRYRGT